jgi:hypothetical protein
MKDMLKVRKVRGFLVVTDAATSMSNLTLSIDTAIELAAKINVLVNKDYNILKMNQAHTTDFIKCLLSAPGTWRSARPEFTIKPGIKSKKKLQKEIYDWLKLRCEYVPGVTKCQD